MKTLLSISLVALLVAGPAAQDGQPFVQPGDNLRVENIPPIPQSLVDETRPYTESRPALFGSWHPAKREMLILTRFAETNQVHRVAAPGASRTQLTFFPDRVVDASYPPADRGFFVFSKDVGGGEWFQNYRFDEADGTITLLTDGKSRNSGGVWSRRGDRLAYTSTRRTGRDTDIYVVDPANPASDRLLLAVDGGGWTVLDWSPDDETLLVREYVSITETSLHLVNASTGERRRIAGAGTTPVAYLRAAYGPDGRIFVTSDRDSEFQRLAVLDPATGRETVLVSGIEWDVDAFDVARDGQTIAFVVNEDGTNVLYLLDPAGGSRRRVEGLPAGVMSRPRFHPDSTHVAVRLAAARTPGDVFSVNARSGAVERWTFSETGGLNPERFAEPELVRWKSFDGRMISGYLYMARSGSASSRAPDRTRRPVVINIHGGPESQYKPGFLQRNNYLIDELGLAVIYPNVRGSSGYGRTFVTLDNGLRREDSYRDIAALLDWIATRPDLDAGRVMVMGGSYGGFMTYAVATNYSDRICCSLAYVGISNLRTFLENTESYRRDLRRAEYGDERDPQVRELMERIAAVNNPHRITKPIFIVQGRNDPRVPWTESQQIVDALRKRGAPYWYLLAEDEGHGFAKKRNVDFMFHATLLFMKQFLLGEGATD